MSGAEAAILIAATGLVLVPLCNKMVDKGLSYIGAKLPHKLKDVETALAHFEMVLERAEKSQHKDQVVIWLQELKEALYEAEDKLDKIEYKRIQEGVQTNREHKVTADTQILSKKKKLKYTLMKLQDVATKAKSTVRELLDVQITKDRNIISMVPLNQVLGRDIDRRNIIEKLRKLESGEGHSALTSLPAVAIFGRAGIGKTTLAQYVCEYEKSKDHFSRIMWVNVSRSFSAFTAMKEIMEFVSVTECFDQHDPSCLNSLQAKLQKKLEGKKFLLVLDKVWWDKDCVEEWELLFRCLEVGEKGSKILITTQETKAAQAFGATGDNFYILQDIEEDKFVEHFKRYALPASSDSSPPDVKEFDEIGKEIAQNLKRDLTAAKIVGMELRQKGVEYWREVSKNDWLDETLRAPMLSFQQLPADLQRCFSFCSIYPKGYVFEESDLISLWIAEGFIRKPLGSSKRMEDMVHIGKMYLDDLVSMSYFQLCKTKVDKDGKKYYVMDESSHDLAERVSKGECFQVQKSEQVVPSTVHHLYIKADDLAKHKEGICRLKNLRTLIIMGDLAGDGANDILIMLLNELKKLRVLSLSFPKKPKFLGSIGELEHLRFLSLGKTPVVDQTKSFSALYHLQVLSYTQDGQHLSSVPANLSNLINLRVLDIIVNGGESIKKQVGQKTGQLHRLTELRNLSIKCLENTESKEGKSVKATFNLGGFEPPENLTELTMIGYQGETRPPWMEGNSRRIKSFTFSDSRMEDFPSMKKLLPCCKTLRLKQVNIRSLSGIPATLTTLVIDNCPFLVFKEDPKMSDQDVSPPLLPTSLRELTIKACTITDRALSSYLQGLTALICLHLVGNPEITTLPSEVVLSQLTALRDLHIESCCDLESFGGFGALISLKQLKIRKCSSLLSVCLANSSSTIAQGCVHEPQITSPCVEDSLGAISLPLGYLTSLVNLEVKRCPKLTLLVGLHMPHSGIQTMTIMGCPKLANPASSVDLSSLYKLTIDDTVLLAKLQGLASLKELTVKNAKEKSFANDGFSHLSSLRSLKILDCTDLESLPHLPESLEHLEIYNRSGKLHEQLSEEVTLERSKNKHIIIKIDQLPDPSSSACQEILSNDKERKRKRNDNDEENNERGTKKTKS